MFSDYGTFVYGNGPDEGNYNEQIFDDPVVVHFGPNEGGGFTINLECYGINSINYYYIEAFYEADPVGPPSVALAVDSGVTEIYETDSLSFTASASVPDGCVQVVKFYLNGTLVKSDTTVPYTYTYSGGALGSHTVHAVASAVGGPSTSSSSIGFTVSELESAPEVMDARWIPDIDGDGYMEEVVDVFVNRLDAFDFAPAVPGVLTGQAFFQQEVEYYTYCAENYSFWFPTFLYDWFLGDRWGDYLPHFYYVDYDCETYVDSAYGNVNYPGAEPGARYRLQTRYGPDGIWVGVTLGSIVDFIGTQFGLEVNFGEWFSLSDIPIYTRILKMGTAGSGSALQTIPDLDGDGIGETAQVVQPEVKRAPAPGSLGGIFELEIPAGVVINPPGTGLGSVLEIQKRKLGEVLWETAVVYAVTGTVTLPISISTPGLPLDKIELRLVWRSKKDLPGPIYVPINDDNDNPEDDLVKVINPYNGQSGGTVRLDIVNNGSGRIKVWSSATKGTEFTSGHIWNVGAGATLPDYVYLEGVTLSPNPYDIELKFTSGSDVASSDVSVYPLEVDIFETAQPINRVGYNDDRPPSESTNDARNKILIWRSKGNVGIRFGLECTSRAHGPVWIEIEDRSGTNSNLPLLTVVDGASAEFSFKLATFSYDEDLVVKFGKDLNGDGTLSGSAEVKGEYEVYGLSSVEILEAMAGYRQFQSSLINVAREAHNMFLGGGAGFSSISHAPDLPPLTEEINVKGKFTHFNGAVFVEKPDYIVNGRPYINAEARVKHFRWSAGSPGSQVIVNSEGFKNGLRAHIEKSYAEISAKYGNLSGWRNITISLTGASFDFGAIGSVGLGGVSVSGEPKESRGTVDLSVFKSGSIFLVNPGMIVNMNLVDVFDFNYFNEAGNFIIGVPVRASSLAATVQSAYNKPGGFVVGSYGIRGQVNLLDFRIDNLVDLGPQITVLQLNP